MTRVRLRQFGEEQRDALMSSVGEEHAYSSRRHQSYFLQISIQISWRLPMAIAIVRMQVFMISSAA
jgi:hypothetical protein